jgi:hypothetical protein
MVAAEVLDLVDLLIKSRHDKQEIMDEILDQLMAYELNMVVPLK